MFPSLCLLGLMIIGRAGCFLPHGVVTVTLGAHGSKHHGYITAEALYDTADWFLRENADIYPPGIHEKLKNSASFRKVVRGLMSFVGKPDTSFPFNRDPSYHFTAERFVESNQNLILNREKVINAIKTSNFDSAWPSAGWLFHTLQDFYSSSNWIEMGNTEIKEGLGTASAFDDNVFALPGEQTCLNCETLGECQENIKRDILSGKKLTSGYFSKHVVPKPEGKCGYGGIRDDFRDMDATGGINKDTNNSTISPHHYLHDQAARLAREATVDMLKGIFEGLIEDRGSFGKFLGLEVLTSLCFVIDTTGSMGDEIAGVKNLTIEMTKESEGTGTNYVLVPVNDPHPNLIYMTNSSREMIRLLGALTASGGGDAPEMSMSGMLLAAQNVRFGSKCYVFTDADAKDKELAETLKSVLTLRSVQMNFKLTSLLRKRKKRSTGDRKEVADAYKEIAEVSGGSITLVKKGELSKALSIIKVEAKISSAVVTLASLVLNTTFEFHVDSTMNDTFIEVTTIDSNIGGIDLTSPSGSLIRPELVTDLPSNKLLKMTGPENGRWTAQVKLPGSTDKFSYRVFSQTQIDFTYILISTKGIPIDSLPIKGEEYFISIQAYGLVNKDSLSLLFLSSNGTLLSSTKVNFTISDLVAKSVLPPEDDGFFLAVQGLDLKNRTFRRTDPNMVRTSQVTLELALHSNETMDVKPGNTTVIKVKLVNQGIRFDSWTVKVFDSESYLYSQKSLQLKVPSNTSQEFELVFLAPKTAHPGQVTTVSVMVSSSIDPRIKNSLVFYIAIIPEKSDLESPTCVITSISTSACSRVDPDSCFSSNWSASVEAQDLDSGLAILRPTPTYDGSSFAGQPFTRGTREVVRGSYDSSCCHPNVTIVAVDGNGNVGRCLLQVDEPKPRETLNAVNPFHDLISLILSMIAAKFP